MKKIILALLLPISVFGQNCHEAKIDYAVQIFSTRTVELFDGKHIQQEDSLIIEKVCLKDKANYRILVHSAGFNEAEQLREYYKKWYPDCFVVKYVNRKRYN